MKRSWRWRLISAGLLASNSASARAMASPVTCVASARSRCAPPTGSVMMTSMTPSWSRSCAVIFMLVAASIALAEARQRMEAGASGGIDQRYHRNVEPVGHLHEPHGLAVALGHCHAEVVADAAFRVGALLVADRPDRAAAKSGEPPHHR